MTAQITELYSSCQNDLLKFLYYRLRCRETAEDLAQEAFLILARVSETACIESPRSFLYRTAANLAIDYIRHQKVISRHLEEALPQTEEVEADNPERQILLAQQQLLFTEALGKLPPRTRDIIILNRLHDMSYKQIAQSLRISESAVEKHISRGLQHCRRELGKYFLV